MVYLKLECSAVFEENQVLLNEIRQNICVYFFSYFSPHIFSIGLFIFLFVELMCCEYKSFVSYICP